MDHLWTLYTSNYSSVGLSLNTKTPLKVCCRGMEEGLRECTVDMSMAFSRTIVSQTRGEWQSHWSVCRCWDCMQKLATAASHSSSHHRNDCNWNCSLHTPTETAYPTSRAAQKEIWVWGSLCTSSWVPPSEREPSQLLCECCLSSASRLSSFPVALVRFPEPTCAECCVHTHVYVYVCMHVHVYTHNHHTLANT